MAIFSYKIEHDLGLAPNPFGQYCTLVVCKPTIRNNKHLCLGDWVIGTGSVKLQRLHHLIFAMKIDEVIPLNDYWHDARFQYKKPVLNGSLAQLYGDNIYHRNQKTGKWIQDNSAHSLDGRTVNMKHLNIDINGKNALISQRFYYFGGNSISIPNKFSEVCSEGRNMKGPSIPMIIGDKFIRWVEKNYVQGIHGDPIDWKIILNPYE